MLPSQGRRVTSIGSLSIILARRFDSGNSCTFLQQAHEGALRLNRCRHMVQGPARFPHECLSQVKQCNNTSSKSCICGRTSLSRLCLRWGNKLAVAVVLQLYHNSHQQSITALLAICRRPSSPQPDLADQHVIVVGHVAVLRQIPIPRASGFSSHAGSSY